MYKAVIVEDEPWSLMNIKTIFPWQNYNFEQPTGLILPKTHWALLLKINLMYYLPILKCPK